MAIATTAATRTTTISTVWQCAQMRAGQVWSKVLFQSRPEAELFVRQMQRAEPDIFWRMEAVPAQAMWN